MTCRTKALQEKDLSQLQSLERELGSCIVAFEQHPRVADLSEAQLSKLQALEKELNAVLVAYVC